MTKVYEAYEVSSMGKMYRKSIEMFAHHYETEDRIEIELDTIAVGDKFFVLFESGTGLTRTSAVRIA